MAAAEGENLENLFLKMTGGPRQANLAAGADFE
jgi:hypothetical protein